VKAQSGEIEFVQLAYVDDCQSDRDCRFHVIGATIIADKHFVDLEGYLRWLVELSVPEELRGSFEFHAKDLFHGSGVFEGIDKDKVIQLFGSALDAIRGLDIPIVYGAVDAHKLRGSIHATASPADVAFRLCMPEIERWFAEKAPDELGIVICDDTTNQQQKRQFQAAFRAGRPKVKMELEKDDKGKGKIVGLSRGPYEHLHDDMYFGNSGDSTGIQLADMCCFIIHRHLEGKQDTPQLYKVIEPHIFAGKVE
jgi:hypothetical protein